MTQQLTKAQIDAIKVELAKVGLGVSVLRKPKTVGDVIKRSKWYKRPSLARLGAPYSRSMRFVTTNYRFDREAGTYHPVA